FFFNIQGVLIEGKEYDGKSLVLHIDKKYNNNGDVVKIRRYNSDDQISDSIKFTYKYNKYNQLIEENSYENEDFLSSQTTYEYDSKGNLLEKNIYTYEGDVVKMA